MNPNLDRQSSVLTITLLRTNVPVHVVNGFDPASVIRRRFGPHWDQHSPSNNRQSMWCHTLTRQKVFHKVQHCGFLDHENIGDLSFGNSTLLCENLHLLHYPILKRCYTNIQMGLETMFGPLLVDSLFIRHQHNMHH